MRSCIHTHMHIVMSHDSHMTTRILVDEFSNVSNSVVVVELSHQPTEENTQAQLVQA